MSDLRLPRIAYQVEFRQALSDVTGVPMEWASPAAYSSLASTQEHVTALIDTYGLDAVVDAFAEVYSVRLSRRISELRLHAVNVLDKRLARRARLRDEARTQHDIGLRVAHLQRAALADGLELFFVPDLEKPGDRHLVTAAKAGAVLVTGSRGRRVVSGETLARFGDLAHWVEGRP